MEQKNTIVKCKAHPNCLFNYNGVCDNYVINIGADGKCESYVETELQGISRADCKNVQKMLEKAGVTVIESKGEVKRGQRAKCDFIQDGVDQKIVNEVCKPLTHYTDKKPIKIKQPNVKIKTVISMSKHVCDWSCKHALRDGPSFNPYIWCDLYQLNPVQGFTCNLYEEG